MSESTVPLNLQQQRKRAKELLKSAIAGEAGAITRIAKFHPQVRSLKLAYAQLTIAREAGFDSWAKLVSQVESREIETIARALHSGDAETLRKMLASSARLRRKINEPLGEFGQRAVHLAAKHRAVLDVLIDFGADINARSEWDKGPFGVLDECDEETARHLISRGATLTAHAAARLGWLDELRRIVNANHKVVDEKGGDGQRPLHFAKTPQVADFLLDHGAQIDARCEDHHSTAAQYALVERQDVCRRLLERGATADIFMPARLGDVALAERLIEEDPSCLAARTRVANYPAVHPFGIYLWTLGFFISPHEVALKFGHRDVYELMSRKSPPKIRLFDAIMRGDRAAAEKLRPGVTIDPDDDRMLAIAIFHQQFDAARLMLDLGFDPSARGIDGGTALHAAAMVGSLELVDTIIRSGRVNLNEPDPTHKSTPLGWAVWGSTNRCCAGGDYAGVVRRLILAGAEAPDSLKQNPLVEEAVRSR